MACERYVYLRRGGRSGVPSSVSRDVGAKRKYSLPSATDQRPSAAGGRQSGKAKISSRRARRQEAGARLAPPPGCGGGRERGDRGDPRPPPGDPGHGRGRGRQARTRSACGRSGGSATRSPCDWRPGLPATADGRGGARSAADGRDPPLAFRGPGRPPARRHRLPGGLGGARRSPTPSRHHAGPGRARHRGQPRADHPEFDSKSRSAWPSSIRAWRWPMRSGIRSSRRRPTSSAPSPATRGGVGERVSGSR